VSFFFRHAALRALFPKHAPKGKTAEEMKETICRQARNWVDTNVLVRLITRYDPRQTPAADAFVAKGGLGFRAGFSRGEFGNFGRV
jgi:hypothetical protein